MILRHSLKMKKKKKKRMKAKALQKYLRIYLQIIYNKLPEIKRNHLILRRRQKLNSHHSKFMQSHYNDLIEFLH